MTPKGSTISCKAISKPALCAEGHFLYVSRAVYYTNILEKVQNQEQSQYVWKCDRPRNNC
jgi:hypothetical protein